jgi:segregation and condensation protein A
MGYEVRTPVFEGPFDLLLHLILRQEVDLWEVSLSTIVDAYLREIDRMETLDLEVATEFLLIAATLVELKARRLLPAPAMLDLDEELLRFEERDLLLARLLECKTFKDAALALAARIREAARSVPRTAGPEEPFRSLVADPLERIRPAQLRTAAVRALTPRPEPVVNTDHVAPIRASVRDAIETVLAALPEHRPLSFRVIVSGVRDRIEIIVRFLAILELFKQGIVELEQTGTFAELFVTRIADHDRRLDLASLGEWGDDEAESDVDVTLSHDARGTRDAELDRVGDAS